MKKNKLLLIVFGIAVILLQGCGEAGILYDPLLKYEKAGFTVKKTTEGKVPKLTSLELPYLVEAEKIETDKRFRFWDIGTSFYVSNIIIKDLSSNIILSYTNLEVFNVLPASNCVYAHTYYGELLSFDINEYSISTNKFPDIDGKFWIRSWSPKRRYIVIRDEVRATNNSHSLLDSGVSIIDLETMTLTKLYNMKGVNFQDRTSDADSHDRYGYISSDLKRVYIHVYIVPKFDGTISGRSPDELRGYWYIDISSLNLTE